MRLRSAKAAMCWASICVSSFPVPESPFSQVEEHTVPVTRTWTPDAILGYLYSTSFAAPQLFGDRLGNSDQAVRAALAKLSDADTFEEDNEFVIRIGRRGTS